MRFKRYLPILILSAWFSSNFAQATTTPAVTNLNTLFEQHYSAYGAGSNPAATFAQTTTSDWKNCSSNGESCQTREQLVEALNGLHQLIPDMKWQILDTLVSGDKVIIRGQGSGKPIGEFMGIPSTGKSFHIMSIDIHTLSDGKISHTYHLEDWVSAMKQLSGQ